MPESDEHEQMVRFLVRTFEGFGCNNIRAALPEYIDRQPPEIDGFIPDVYDESGHGIYIGEAKILDDITPSHTLDQLTAYRNKSPNVYLCVPDAWVIRTDVVNQLARFGMSKVLRGFLRYPSGDLDLIPA
jgi:hypothetical protein